MVTSPKQLYELEETLEKAHLRKRLRAQRADAVVARMEMATLHRDPPLRQRLTRDPDDDYLILLARSARAVLVSRDRGVLAEHPADVEVMNPHDFARAITRA